MNTAQRAALLAGGIIALIALLVALVLPVSSNGFSCGSAVFADDNVVTFRLPENAPEELQSRQREIERLSAAIAGGCATDRRSRLLLTGVAVVAGAAVMAGGGALFRDRD